MLECELILECAFPNLLKPVHGTIDPRNRFVVDP
jgi:hypothetical protein